MKAAKEELINFLEEVLAPAESNQNAPAADFRSVVHTEVHLADEITCLMCRVSMRADLLIFRCGFVKISSRIQADFRAARA